VKIVYFMRIFHKLFLKFEFFQKILEKAKTNILCVKRLSKNCALVDIFGIIWQREGIRPATST